MPVGFAHLSGKKYALALRQKREHTPLRGCMLCALSVWLFGHDDHVSFCYADLRLLLALWAIEWKMQQECVRIDLYAGLAMTDRAINPL